MALSRDRSRRRNGNEGMRGEDVNPMNYLSNLSDAMLVLAVGIMVALVLHWNVELTSSEMSEDDGGADTFTQSDLYEEGELPPGAQHAGEVYYDEASGEYYFVETPSAGGSSSGSTSSSTSGTQSSSSDSSTDSSTSSGSSTTGSNASSASGTGSDEGGSTKTDTSTSTQ